ncbi:MAG TPA: hypothetical protein VIL58_04810 [Thermoplasmata archaeon]
MAGLGEKLPKERAGFVRRHRAGIADRDDRTSHAPRRVGLVLLDRTHGGMR